MIRKLYLLLAAALLVACADHPVAPSQGYVQQLPDGIRLVESDAGRTEGLSIPYSKYVLDNGLTVILHEDHSDPLVHVDVTYHVGSSREQPGRSGFAHFFEHMMFEGSANVEQGEFSKIISNAGGSLNGSTNSDRTNYYETIPINQLETALWLEADRMGLLLPAVTREQFESQRAAVKNERGQRVDNRPYGRTSETMMKSLYPPDHPYSWPVIGWIEDLEAATLDDLQRFFLHWYGPNNATLTIGGDIDKAQTLEWIEKYFGPIPSGPAVPDLLPRPGNLDADRYVTLEDNIHLPAIAMLFPTVYYRHPDEAPLDAAAKVMGMGRASLLYQRLVQTGRAVSAYVSHACRELACEMAFIVIQNPASGETLAEMEQEVRDTIREFARRGINEDDLQKFIAGFESGQVFGLQSVSGKVSQLAFAEVFSDDPKTAIDDIERYAAVNRDDVMQAFSRYVADRPAVVLSVVPQGRTDLAARQQTFDYMTQGAAQSTRQAGDAADPEPRVWIDDFDRSRQPRPGQNPLVGLPAIEDLKLPNGARLLAVGNTETPTVTIRAVFGAGQRDEPAGKAGLASFTAAMMSEATQRRSAAEFSEELERIGASLSIVPGSYTTSVTLNVLSKYYDRGMALMMERLLDPDLNAEDFERLMSQRMEALAQARKSGPALADRAMEAVLAGPDHPLSFPLAGLSSTVAEISLDDVRAFYDRHIPASLQGVLVSSSLPIEQTLGGLEALGQLDREQPDRKALDPLMEIRGRTVYLVDKAGAAQSSLRLAHPSLPYDATGDYFRAGLMNFNLGGTFDSRINLNLREDKGYTYGARSAFAGGPEFGAFHVSAEVNREATADAVTEVLRELERYARSGMTSEEYDFLQNAVGQRDALRYETPSAKLGLLAQILRYDLPLNYREDQARLLRRTSRESLNDLARRLIEPENLAIVIAGDVATIRADLEGLGLPVRLLNEDGYPLQTGTSFQGKTADD